jgi:small subunit ribosomal protein S7
MRTKKNYTRAVEPDAKHQSVLVNKLINRVMKQGKKTIAMKHVYSAIDTVTKKTKKKPQELMEELVERISPKVEVRTRRVGGASYQVPVSVKPRRATSLAIRWLVTEAAKKPNDKYHTYGEKLAAEMMDALNNEGGAIEKKNNAHRMAEANKAFAHFKW